ncbi:TetR/AcrR family transcriptional regulator [Mesobacillus subterraneus]|uniref:TetR/AcrR family transcriptional regulator n=1 Tax=Mesobacillus subterraneus TaxID=285983 RepID=A0A427TRA8_9BACI|nr:TetR/AcrR family transcriptional regulator [Mesobacillus subterraneus]RSD26888.1 TetR/AcrR family transcriptional regulator [Mesobacillus subterraneus]
MSEKESSRDKLIKAASRLFQLQGYHGTGLNHILKDSGAPKGSLYYHFPNGKEQLAVESVQLTAELVRSGIQRSMEQKADAVEAIQGFILDLAGRYQNDGSHEGVPIAAVALETSLVSEPIRAACQGGYESFQQVFAEKLIESGYEETRARELGIVINSMIEGAFLLSFTMGSNEPLLLAAKNVPALLR